MSAHQPIVHPAEAEIGSDAPVLRLAEHAIGLWQAAQDMGDAVLLDALRPLVMQVAKALARDVMEGSENGTSH